MPQPYNARKPANRVAAEHLRGSQYLRRLSGPALNHLATCGHHCRFEAGTPIIRQGEPLERLFVVLEGAVSVSIDVGVERPLWLYIAGPGDIVDLGILLEPPAAPVAVFALAPIKAFAIPRGCLLQELDSQPSLGLEMTRHLCERLSLIAKVAATRAGGAPIFSHN